MAIVGAGPAGLLLGQLLHREGVDAVILEARDQDYVQARIRAGVLEQGTVDVLREAGVGERMDREGQRHEGIYLCFDGRRHRIPMSELTGGRSVMVYGQTEVVRDLITARQALGAPLHFDCDDVEIDGLAHDEPVVRYRRHGERHELRCDFVAGCDGFHGICRPTIPRDAISFWTREYPFGWLGILAEVAPSTDELIYAYHDRGFALHSMRSATISRLYIQVTPDDDIANWSDRAIWDELHVRLASDGWSLAEGEIIDKAITPMRSFVAAPMRYRSLLLAGDSAHIVPPDGGQGTEPRGLRRDRARRRARHAFARRLRRGPGRVLRPLPGAHLARPALLVVDDLDAAHRSRRRRLRSSAAALAAALHRVLDAGRHVAGRELRRPPRRADRRARAMAELTTLHDAVAELVHDGDAVAIEGFTHLIPFAAGHEILRQGRRELELIRMTPDILYDQMIGVGAARRLVFSYGGNPGVGSLHRFRDAVENEWPRAIELEEHSHAGMANRYAAGASRMPFAVMRGYVGTDLAALTQVKPITCPFTGEELVAVPALRPGRGDHPRPGGRRGRQRPAVGDPRRAEGGGARAPTGRWSRSSGSSSALEPRPGGIVLPGWVIDAVALAPGGSQPSYSLGITSRDNDFYRAWDKLSRDREEFSAWMREHVLDEARAR